jgi:hypothetical protein
MKRLLLTLTLLVLASSSQAQKINTIDGTNQMIDKIMNEPINRFGHYVILDHDSVFSEVPGHVERWDCHVTYAIDLGYGYSRGPFRLRITLQPDPIHEHKWITYLDIIAL